MDALLISKPDLELPSDYKLSMDTSKAWHQLQEVLNLPSSVIVQAVSSAYHADIVNIHDFKPPRQNPFSENICREIGILPFDLSCEVPVIASYDPRLASEQRQQLRFILGSDFILSVLSPDDIDLGLTRLFAPHVDNNQAIDLASASVGESETTLLAKAILRSAIDKRASDIHIHPMVGGAAIRFRVDGVLKRIATFPKQKLDSLSRFFAMNAGLDLNPLIAQDGRMQLIYGQREIDVRLSLLPVLDGIRVVCRLLEQGKQFSLINSGFSPYDYHALKRLVSYGSGIVLLTGPTGSGKTSTLYALLSELNSVDVNIMTLENPVEYMLPGISQVQINDKQGLSFADTLRSILRQDPDIVLVGEIRDGETARIAAQAALTGHMVLSTLHTNDAIAAIPRLLDLGVDPSLLTDALVGVVSQRLVRKLCPSCKTTVNEPLLPEEEEYKRITGESPGCRTVGCEVCHFTGFIGRLPVTEILEISPDMRTVMLSASCNINDMTEASKGFKTQMAVSAGQWVVSGETTVQELSRELGLRFWRELAKINNTRTSILSEGFAGSSNRQEDRLKVLLISDRIALQTALTNNTQYGMVYVDNEKQAADVLKKDASIIGIMIDATLMQSTPAEWLTGLRKQLAWSGIPVLFLLPPKAHETKELLTSFNAFAVEYEEGVTDLLDITHELQNILIKGAH
jgi:type II secretory ATPase GspE/PulE/Tfp pilus assembly ATPase PilB-like protein